MTLLILLLTASESVSADQAVIKKMFVGDRVTYNGTLFNDEALRQIDIDLLEKDICEKQLNSSESYIESGWSWGEFVIGASIGGALVYALTH